MYSKILIFTYFSAVLLILGQFACAPEKEHNSTMDHELGVVDFPISCNEMAQEEFLIGLAQLHHMMYEMSRPHFEKASEADPDCAMAYWGIAMTHFQPLWHPTSEEDLEKGKAAVDRARAIGVETDREEAYIAAVEAFFTDPVPPQTDRPSDHEARLKAWVDAMRTLHDQHPEDIDAAALYGLAEVSYAQSQFSPEQERDYTRQMRAGDIMESLLEDHPKHPGLFHYIIHAYDSPALASRGEEIARGYDKIAPNTPHALHMPSHIFVRLGLWEETVHWNIRSAEAALEHPVNGMTTLHYPHALDYLMYGYLQQGEFEKAEEVLNDVIAIEKVQPTYASAYGIMAPQVRYYLEQRKWEEAAEIEMGNPEVLNWEDYPSAKALLAYGRGLGAARTGDLDRAYNESEKIKTYVKQLMDAGNNYWGYMTQALGKAVDAWALYETGETEDALNAMREAAELEESMDKHPITPGEVLPVRELYADMLMKEGMIEEAIESYNKSLERTPNRKYALNGLKEIQ